MLLLEENALQQRPKRNFPLEERKRYQPPQHMKPPWARRGCVSERIKSNTSDAKTNRLSQLEAERNKLNIPVFPTQKAWRTSHEAVRLKFLSKEIIIIIKSLKVLNYKVLFLCF
jgi:hypothetical protein